MQSDMRFEAKNKSEWFVLESPLGEPEINYKEEEYWIERVVKVNGDIVWFGQGTNWVKEPNGPWKYLGTDESVEMIPEYKNERGEWCGGYYPEGRNIWIECEPPIYEKLYIENCEK